MNKTLGVKGQSPITNPITENTIIYTGLIQNNIDWIATTTQQTGQINITLTSPEVILIQKQYESLFKVLVEQTQDKQLKPITPLLAAL